MKRGLILIVIIIFLSKFVNAGSCDISTWRVTNDDGSVASVVATIDGVTYDFITRQYSEGVERTFYRTSEKTGSGTPISQADAVTLVNLFFSSNLNKLGLEGYGNVRYDSISEGNYIIKADDYIKVNPDNCEGINYITGTIYVAVDPDANIIFINPKIALYTGLSSTAPSLNIPGGGVGAGGVGGGGAVDGKGAGDGGTPSKIEPTNQLQETQEEQKDTKDKQGELYPATKNILGLGFGFIPIFLLIIFVFVFFGIKKTQREIK